MDDRSFSWKKFNQTPIVGILRGLSTEEVLEIVPSYLKSGFYTLEITMNSPDVSKTISTLVKDFPELNVGAGTVCNLYDMQRAVSAGAQFIVTPIIDTMVIQNSVNKGIPIFPGAYTPTEIHTAWSLGASAVKVFPATQLGPQYISDVLAPLNDIKLLPTGGVSMENIKSFFKAGAVGVGMGSSLFNKIMLRDKNFKGLQDYLIRIREEISECIDQ